MAVGWSGAADVSGGLLKIAQRACLNCPAGLEKFAAGLAKNAASSMFQTLKLGPPEPCPSMASILREANLEEFTSAFAENGFSD